ncbi:MAG: hypothetical protein R3B40_31820 [Polyangiales bacterium]
MQDDIKNRFADRERIPLAAWPALLVGDESTLRFLTKKGWTGDETDFVLSRVLRAWWHHSGSSPRALERMHMMSSPDGARIYQACAERIRKARVAGFVVRTHAQHAENITGSSPRMSSKNEISVARYCTDGEALSDDLVTVVQHPLLRSYAEVALDAVLGATVRDWHHHHAHDVRLTALVPATDTSPLDARLSVDTVLVRDGAALGVLEVSRGTLMRGDDYVARRAFKRTVLESAGVPLHECDLPSGPQAIDALHSAASWVVRRLGEGTVPTPAEIRSSVLEAKAEAVLLLSLPQLKPIVQQWQAELGTTPLTLERYTHRRSALIDEEHPLAPSLPAQATLQRMLREARTTLAKVSGGGRRRGQPAHAHAGASAPAPYEVVRARAQALGIRTPAEYLSHSDPTLPRDLKKVYPVEFPADGWSGFLGTGARNADIVGLVPASRVSKVARLDWYRWKAASAGLAPDAERPARAFQTNTRTYYRPKRVVPFLVKSGLISGSDAPRVLAELEGSARRKAATPG